MKMDPVRSKVGRLLALTLFLEGKRQVVGTYVPH